MKVSTQLTKSQHSHNQMNQLPPRLAFRQERDRAMVNHDSGETGSCLCSSSMHGARCHPVVEESAWVYRSIWMYRSYWIDPTVPTIWYCCSACHHAEQNDSSDNMHQPDYIKNYTHTHTVLDGASPHRQQGCCEGGRWSLHAGNVEVWQGISPTSSLGTR